MSAGVIACGGGIAILIPPSITLILFGVLTEESIVKLFFAGFIPGVMLAISNAVVILGVSFYLKLPSGAFSWQQLRSEEHTSELQSLMRISYAVFCLKKKKTTHRTTTL